MTEDARNRIGITLGDPSGVGPELIAHLVAKDGTEVAERILIFCDRSILDRAFIQVTGERVPSTLHIVDRGRLSPEQAIYGRPSRAGAEAQVAYLEAAVNAAKAGNIGGLVTAPISKAQCRSVGFEFPGHTEFLADRLGSSKVVMMFAGPALRVVLVTTHIPLSQVPTSISTEGIVEVGQVAAQSLHRDFGLTRPRIGILGLNPHAGEGGMLGPEEASIIAPAVQQLGDLLGETAAVSGPLVPDVAFRRGKSGEFDCLVAMYHDQALIPIKLIDFELAVNVTLGLPIVRTSPDHGVAYDIAGSRSARPDSFIEAYELCSSIMKRRQVPVS